MLRLMLQQYEKTRAVVPLDNYHRVSGLDDTLRAFADREARDRVADGTMESGYYDLILADGRCVLDNEIGVA